MRLRGLVWKFRRKPKPARKYRRNRAYRHPQRCEEQRKEDRNILFDQAAAGRRKPNPGIWFIEFSVDFSLEPTLASVAEIWWQSHHFHSEVGYADDSLKKDPPPDKSNWLPRAERAIQSDHAAVWPGTFPAGRLLPAAGREAIPMIGISLAVRPAPNSVEKKAPNNLAIHIVCRFWKFPFLASTKRKPESTTS
jgi:hypothetical protein